MRIITLAILLLISQILVAQSYNEVEDLAKAYISALRKMETSSFQPLYTPDTTTIGKNMRTNLGFSYSLDLLQDFTTVIQEGIEKGIDWDRIKYVKTEYITKRDGPFLLAHPCVIIFQHRLFRYAIYMNASKIDNSWRFVPIQTSGDRIMMQKI